MEKRQIIVAVVMGLALALAGTFGAGAAVVGRLTQVEGRVNLLKGGNLPAITVKTGDPVEPGDVVRTKSLSRAQITFIDKSILTISPESRIAIAEYLVDTAQRKRRAVLEIFQGLALAVVNKIFQVTEPDFVIKTHTAITGVRGTEIGFRLSPNSSTIMNFKGRSQVGNIFPEVSQRFLKTFKVAYASIPWNQYPGRWVFLEDMQGTVVGRDLPPTLPYTLTPQDRELFMRALTVFAPKPSQLSQGSEKPLSSAAAAGASASTIPVTPNAPGEQTILTVLNTVTVPPTLLPPSPSTASYTFSQIFEGTYTKPSDPPYAIATYINSSQGTGTRTGVYPATFTANFSIVASGPPNTFSSSSSGTFSASSTANVSGSLGGALTGTMSMNASTGGGTSFNLSGPVTLNANGNLAFQTTGTFNVGGVTGTTTGTWTQTNSPAIQTASRPR
jgi:hypothetical protein